MFAVLLVLLAGCAKSVNYENLKADGYVERPVYTNPEKTERVTNYAIWLKEVTTPRRRVRVCIIPKVPVAEYGWQAYISVDGVERMAHSNFNNANAGKKLLIDCVLSPPLPTGELTYKFNFTYKPR